MPQTLELIGLFASGHDTILKLANSLAPEDPLRKTFLSMPSVSRFLAGNGIQAQVHRML